MKDFGDDFDLDDVDLFDIDEAFACEERLENVLQLGVPVTV